ncbi:hypothetical protein B484DRAFT_454159 [Ochromonadaceae sp. CCMP2298]|nr:hypothetical protein B484DRAFT_454159 [Ochromonadaceae sp. CCMP2298]|mmetsp:Transcript_28470/g.63090  ORF Transcript_28470/g.63090 Transcript_28470/m.63090 type:complete len:255 (-) Transcript_28470:628-1392(-)
MDRVKEITEVGEDRDDNSLYPCDDGMAANTLNNNGPLERRRERNKLLARKTRQKVKSVLQSTKDQLQALIDENKDLKRKISETAIAPVTADVLLNVNSVVPDCVAELVKFLTKGSKDIKELHDNAFCVANAISFDYPLVYISPGFTALTGYESGEVIGRNCRFLQGPETDQSVHNVRNSIIGGFDISCVVRNYRKDGTAFWNQLQLAHLKDQLGRTFLILGLQTEVRMEGGLLLPCGDALSPPLTPPSNTLPSR